MRKQNKIISLILVVALLFSMLVIAAPAAAAEESESFTPSATFTATKDSAGIISAVGVSGSILGTVAFSQCNDGAGMTAGILTDSETGKKFLDVKGNISSTDTYIQFWPAAAYQPIYKEATNKYFVLDFDMATYEDVTNSFGFYALSRSSGGRFGTNVAGTDFTNAVNALEKGVLHHYTYALDVDNNTGYLFINGNYVKTVSNAVYGSEDVADTEYADSSSGLKFEQFRMFPNNVFDVTVANVNMRKTTDATMASALSAKNISLWSEYGYSDYEAAYVPAFATVEGAKVYNYDAINAALADGVLPAKVEFLRDCNEDITVNCDATVETHGLDVKLNPADGVTVAVDGTVRSYDAPFKSTMSKTEVATPSADLKAQTTDSSTSYISNSEPAEWTSVMPYLVTDVITGNKYLDVRPAEGFDTANTTHNHINYITNNTVYQANTYFITEFDVFVEYEVMKDLTIGVTSRNSGGSNVGGSTRSVVNWGLAAGEWSHVAMIGEVNSNTLYVYVNGARVDSTTYGLWSSGGGETFVADGGYFQGIRLNMSVKTNLNANQNFAIDNVKYTMNKTDSWLASNFGGASLDGWSGNSYTLPAVPVLATVDGVPCGSVAEVEDALFGFEAKKVEIYREYFGTITVSSDAVIQTNGFTVPVASTGVEVSNVGTVYTYDAPYPQSQSFAPFEKPTGAVTAIDEFKAATENNLFKQYQNNATDAFKMKSELVTNNYTGDTFLKISHNTASAGDNSNAYVELQTITAVAPNSNTQYYVIDYDVALFSDVTVSCMIIPRGLNDVSAPNTYNSIWGASNPSLTSLLSGYEYGKMHHITFVYNIDANSLNVFVNNTLVKTVASGAITTDSNHSTYWVAGSTKGIRFDGMRIGSTLAEGGAYALDNISMRVIEDAASGYAADSLTAALNSSNLSVWADGTTEPVSETAPIATVDGEYFYTVEKLNNALMGRTHKNVELLCDLADAVTVSCDATVETNGLAVTVQGIEGSTTTTEGTVITIDAPWSAPASAEKQESSVSGITAPSVAGNLVSSSGTHGLINWKSSTYAETIRADKVTPVGSSETYVELTAIANKTSANHFVNVSRSDFAVDYTGYYVFDIDVASSTAFFENMNLAFVIRGAAGSSKPYDSGTKPLRSLVEADGEWHHVTVVGDTINNVMYTFVDGKLVDSSLEAYRSANKVENETPTFSGIRINIAGSIDMKLGDSMAIDNMALRNVSDSSITAALTSGNLTDWSGAVTDTLAEKLPSIASVNGKEYSSIQTLEAALADGNNRKVSLDKDLADYTAQMAATGTVTTNGLDNFIVAADGYRLSDNGDGTYTVAKEDRLGTVTVTVNGAPVISAELLYGTDIVDYLYANNSFATSATAFSGDDRTVYYNANWTNAPSGKVNGNVTFACTADVFTGDFLVLDASGAKTDAAATMKAVFESSAYRTVILNKDYDFGVTGVNYIGDRDVFLNGYTMTSTATGNHIVAATLNNKLNIVGGNFVDQSRNNTHSIVFIGYGATGTVTFNNCYIFTVANLVTLRGGNAKFVDCVIEGAQVQGGTLFQIGEYYNTNGTTTNSKLEFVDTEITFSSHRYSGSLSPVFSIKGTNDYTGSGENGMLANANALGLKHVVSFDGCTIAVDHATQTPLALFVANGNTDGNSNLEINISNTVLNVKEFGDVNADVNIGDNVVSAATLMGVGTFAEGVEEIKSGVATAPFGYADDYATVTWSNGDTQLWADGTYPAHALCKDDLVTKVEAGKSYTFAATENHAGLSLKANLSLDTVLKLNVYVAVESGVTALNIGGVSYDVSEENIFTIGGVAYNKFEYELLPHRAAGDITIAVTGADYTVAKAFNLVDYATAVYAAYDDDASRQLVANVLNYVLQAHNYKGVFSPTLVNISTFLSTNAANIQDVSGAVDTMSSVSASITSAQLNLTSAPKWRFNLASGADISTLEIRVGGKAVEYKAYGSYVEIELNACDMLDTISVTIGGATGTYNLAAYCEAQTALIGSTDWNGEGKCGNNIAAGLAYTAKDLVKALYSYAYYAAAYQN